MGIIEKIRQHEKDIVIKQTPDSCQNCKSTQSDFTLHERRHRLFYVIIDSLVHTIESFLGRWKCSLCKTTFTANPEHVLPYKRHVKDQCLSLGKAYVENDAETYRGVTAAIGYTTQTEKIDDRMLAGSTVWRWLSFFGSLEKTLRNTLDLIRQKDPNSTVFRKQFPIHRKKYQSKKRKHILERAFRWFTAEAELKLVFGHKYFPDLATGNFRS